MEVKRLEAEEFECLKQFPDGFCPDPAVSRAGVVKDGDKLVGRIFLVAPVHVEGPWLEPEYRGGTLAKRIMDWAEREAKEAGVSRLFAYGSSKELESYLERLGFTKQELTVWAKEI